MTCFPLSRNAWLVFCGFIRQRVDSGTGRMCPWNNKAKVRLIWVCHKDMSALPQLDGWSQTLSGGGGRRRTEISCAETKALCMGNDRFTPTSLFCFPLCLIQCERNAPTDGMMSPQVCSPLLYTHRPPKRAEMWQLRPERRETTKGGNYRQENMGKR